MLLYKWLRDAARKSGNAKALMYRDTYLSWRGLEHRVERRAQELASMGIGKGQWIGLMLGNVPDFAILTLALSKLGATVVPLDPTTGTRDLSLVVELAQLKGLITRPRGGVDTQTPAATPGVVAAPKPVVEKKPGDVIETRRRLQGTLLTCSLYKRPKDSQLSGEAPEAVLFTSDSSGEPKGVLRSAEELDAGAENLRTTLEVTAEDRILTTVPLHHAFGFDLGLVLALRHGATLFIEDEIAPKRVAKILREQEIDLLPATPPLYAGLAKIPTARVLKGKRARFLAAGAALPEAVAEQFREEWGVRLMTMYHTTEAQAVTVDRKGLSPDSVGKTVDGVELKVGDNGTVWVRSKAVARRSIGAANPVGGGNGTVAAIGARSKRGEVPIGGFDADGWFRTGDKGKLDRTGKLSLAGREDDLVKVDGKRVALGEIDACLETFPKVKAAQTRLISDPLAGSVVVAKVVISGKCVAEEIIDHCAKNLAPYKVPRRIEFCERLS